MRAAVLRPTVLSLILGVSPALLQSTRSCLQVGPCVLRVGLPIAAAQAPAPTTEREFRELVLQWNRRTLAGLYQEVGSKNPAWDEPALALLDLFARYVSRVPGAPDQEEVLAAAEPLMDSGCTDPLVLYCVGVALDNNGRPSEAETFVRRAVEGFRGGRYPPCQAWLAARRLARICNRLGGEREAEIEQWLSVAVEWLVETAAGESFADGEQRVFWEQITAAVNRELKPRGHELYQALSAEPDADPWIVDMVGGEYHIHAAWAIRGDGLAKDVDQRAWPAFEEQLSQAGRCLRRAWNLHPEFPEPAVEMMTLVAAGSGEPGETLELWFKRAVAAQIDYERAYEQRLYYSRPRWGGSIRTMYDFGLECLETGRFDTRVPQWLYAVVAEIELAEGQIDFWRRSDVYESLCAMFEGLLAEPSRADQRTWYKSLHAAVAWRGGRYDDAKQLLDELGEGVYEQAFTREFGIPMRAAKGEVLAATGPLAREARWAEELARHHRVSEALYILQHLPQPPPDELTAFHLKDRLFAWGVEEAISEDQWVSLLPEPGFPGWEYAAEPWSLEADGSLKAAPSGSSLLVSRARIDGNYEIRGEIEFESADSQALAGIVVSYRRTADPYWRAFTLEPASGRASLGRERAEVAIEPTNEVHVQVWNSRVIAELNGEPVFVNHLLGDAGEATPHRQIGFYARGAGTGDEVTVRFRNIQIRGLTARPDALGG